MKKQKLIFRIAAVFILLNISNGASAQGIEWENTIQGNISDYLHSVDRCIEGGYILGGWSFSDALWDKTENSNGAHDYWIMKIDDSGTILWQNTIGGNDGDQLESIQQTSDGGYILGGWSASVISGDKTENSQGVWDYWVVKTNALGSIQWQNTIGGSLADYLYCVRQTVDGGYILGGASVSPASGDKTENSQGTWDYWIIKLNEAGNIEWQNTIGGDTNDILYYIEQTNDGGYIAGGYSFSGISGDKTEISQGSNDYWVVKLDATGNIEWQNTIGGNSGENLFSLQECADGGYILGGNSGSGISGDKTEITLGPSDYWIVKLDAAGNIQWQNTIGGSAGEVVRSIKQTIDRGYVIAGTSTSNISGDKNENCIGSNDYWIVKLDSSGNIRWQNTIGGSAFDNVNAICETREGDLIAGGYSASGISGDKSENLIGSNDYWVVKLTSEFNTISGKMFYDMNSNLVQDTGEPAVANNKITTSGGSRISFSLQDGSYSISVVDTGNITVTPSSIVHYNVVPASHTSYFNGFGQTDSLNDFAFQPVPFNDLLVTITPTNDFRSGFDAYYMIQYRNIGTTTLPATLVFFPDSNLTYITASVTPSAVTTDSVSWSLGTLTPLQEGNILVTVHVLNGLPFNTLISSSARIDPVAGDYDPVNNYSSSGVYSINSFDPNDILVNRDTVFTTELISPPWLEYVIRFQNTGNAAAINVHVLNKIQPQLDLSTFELITSSHPVTIFYSAVTGYMDFGFDNIYLPDSNANEPGSHGFVRYRIKPFSTLVAGDSIANTASIYFDFNAPVYTNTAVTHIVIPTGITEMTKQQSSLTLYPNPASGSVILKTDKPINKNSRLKITDIAGRVVYRSAITDQEQQIKIDISGFSEGLYLVELESYPVFYRTKMIKQN